MAKTKATKKRLGWHFLPSNMQLEYGDNRKVTVGSTLSSTERPVVCSRGMHASASPSEAARYRKGPVLCRVEVWGEISEDSDKFCGKNRKVLWAKELSVDDLRKLSLDTKVDLSGWSTGLNQTGKPTLLDKLGTACPNPKIDAWLENWANKNGLSGSVSTILVKPQMTEKTILSLLIPRVVRTRKEIRANLAGYKNVGDFDDMIDDMSGDKVYYVEDLDGFVLAPRKR